MKKSACRTATILITRCHGDGKSETDDSEQKWHIAHYLRAKPVRQV